MYWAVSRCVFISPHSAAVVYNDTLSKESRDKLTHIYAQKLATAHSDICVHRNKAKGYLEHDTTTNRLPILLLSSLPAPEAHLLEHLEPVALFSQRAQSVLEVTRTLTLTLEFSPGMEAVWDALLDKIRPPPNVHAECWHTALQLALLGWQPVEDDTKSCECRLCLARLPLTDSSSKGFRKRRRRVLHPVDQHKYYCPYVVGIVGHVPLWKWLAVRLLGAESVKHDTEGNDQDKAPRPTAWEQVHRFLGRALSRHRK